MPQGSGGRNNTVRVVIPMTIKTRNQDIVPEIFGHREGDAIQLWVAIISVILVSALIGHYLEKQRPAWSQFFKKLLELNKLRLIKLLPHLKTSNKAT